MSRNLRAAYHNVYIFNVILLPFTKVLCPNAQLQKDSLGKNYERTVVSDFAILSQKVSKIAPWKKKVYFLVFVNHPAVHSGGYHQESIPSVTV